MAYPNGISTFTLTFGAAAVLGADEQLGMKITVTASTNAIWSATGQPFLIKTQTASAPVGQSGSITLISPDQAGFVNAYGVAVRNWTYAVHLDYVDAQNNTVGSADKNFAYLASMGSTIDLDTTVPVSTSAGVTVDIPAGSGGGSTVTDSHIIAVIASALRAAGTVTITSDTAAGTITITGTGTGGTTPPTTGTLLLLESGDQLITEAGDLIAA
jgi:hypothetical protein